jgi:hypothetical protein
LSKEILKNEISIFKLVPREFLRYYPNDDFEPELLGGAVEYVCCGEILLRGKRPILPLGIGVARKERTKS